MPHLIIVCGLPGSGKTTLAEALAASLNAVHLNTDRMRNTVEDANRYSDEAKGRVYDALFTKAQAVLQSGRDVILDGTFYKSALRDTCMRMASEAGVAFSWIEVTAPEEIIRERVSRKRPYTEADYNVYLKIKEEYEALPTERLILNSGTLSIGDMVLQARQFVTMENR